MDCLPLPELCHHLELQQSMTLALVKTPQTFEVTLGLGGVGGKTRPLHSFSGQKLFLRRLFHCLCTYVLFQKPTSFSLAWFLLFAEPLRAEPACPYTMSSRGSSGSPPRHCFVGWHGEWIPAYGLTCSVSAASLSSRLSASEKNFPS